MWQGIWKIGAKSGRSTDPLSDSDVGCTVAASLAYMLLQVVPLPAAAVKGLSPQTYRIYQEAIGLLEPVRWLPLSIRPGESLAEFFRYGSYVAVYILGVQLLSHRVFLQRTVNTVAVFATLLAFVAILQHFTAAGEIFWLKKMVTWLPTLPCLLKMHGVIVQSSHYDLRLTLYLLSGLHQLQPPHPLDNIDPGNHLKSHGVMHQSLSSIDPIDRAASQSVPHYP